ncbi:transposase family protein [Streptomyces sp. NBC_00151]|nr:transposase family protein [Streptomyces sp. NBC_00151]WRZ37998.1 transposase family protein [Streptomyces sp. NBC_00151]
MRGVLRADPLWVETFTGLRMRQFERLLKVVRERGGDGPGGGRPWCLPLADRVLLVAVYYRTNLTMRQLAPLFGISPATVCRVIQRLRPLLAIEPASPPADAVERLWIVDGTLIPVRDRKGAGNTLAALRSIRAARPDGAPIYVILDNLSAHKGDAIRRWARKNRVQLCFTPTYASWANPIEAHFGPLRQFTVANSHHRSHPAQTRALHAYLRWRNKNARHPDVLAAQRNERARIRSEKGIRWGGRALPAEQLQILKSRTA